MPINTPSYAYPFDPKGELSSNLIVGEQHIISSIQGIHYQKIVPRWAPYFAADIKLRFQSPQGQSRDLILGQDYYLGHRFLSASRSTGKPVYGSINIIDRSLQGVVIIDQYRTLGGSWTIDHSQILEILADQIYNPRIVTWEFVIERPINFPVTSHEWDVVDMKGTEHVNEKLVGIRDAIYYLNSGMSVQHLQDFNNPHKVTAAQLNAVTTDVFNHQLNLKLDKTATSVNSDKLEGRDVETLTEEILKGTSANTQLFDNKDLNQVREYVLLGKAADAERYNGMDLAQFDIYIRERLSEINVIDVTATNTDRFAGRNWIEATEEILQGKAADSASFDGHDKEQYYEYIKNNLANEDAVELTAMNSLKLEGMTLDQVVAKALLGTAANSERFSGMSLAEFEIHINDLIANLGDLPGTAANSLRLENQTLEEVLNMAKDQGVDNATKFNGYTWDEAVEFILNGQIHDSKHLEGETLEDIVQTSVAVAKQEGGMVSAINYSVPQRSGTNSVTILPVGSALLIDPSNTDSSLVNAIGRIEFELHLKNDSTNLPLGNYSKWAITTRSDLQCTAELVGGTVPPFKYQIYRDDRSANVIDYTDEDDGEWKQRNYYMVIDHSSEVWVSVKTQSGLVGPMPTNVLPTSQLSALTSVPSTYIADPMYATRTINETIVNDVVFTVPSLMDSENQVIPEDLVGPVMYHSDSGEWSLEPPTEEERVNVVEKNGEYSVRRINDDPNITTNTIVRFRLQVSRRT